MRRPYDFIQVNNSILDYSEYSKNILLLKNYLKHRIIELLLEEGFRLESEKNSSYHSLDMQFYHQEKDLELTISITKRTKESWA